VLFRLFSFWFFFRVRVIGIVFTFVTFELSCTFGRFLWLSWFLSFQHLRVLLSVL